MQLLSTAVIHGNMFSRFLIWSFDNSWTTGRTVGPHGPLWVRDTDHKKYLFRSWSWTTLDKTRKLIHTKNHLTVDHEIIRKEFQQKLFFFNFYENLPILSFSLFFIRRRRSALFMRGWFITFCFFSGFLNGPSNFLWVSPTWALVWDFLSQIK